jgi:hypothetical protein
MPFEADLGLHQGVTFGQGDGVAIGVRVSPSGSRKKHRYRVLFLQLHNPRRQVRIGNRRLHKGNTRCMVGLGSECFSDESFCPNVIVRIWEEIPSYRKSLSYTKALIESAETPLAMIELLLTAALLRNEVFATRKSLRANLLTLRSRLSLCRLHLAGAAEEASPSEASVNR